MAHGRGVMKGYPDALRSGRPGAVLVPGRRRSLHGFTLIELLVVISLIALLLAIVLPSMTEAKRMAKLISCTSNLRSTGVGLASYVTDHDGRYPTPSATFGVHVEGVDVIDNRQNMVEIAGHRPADIYFCPLNPGARPADSPVTNAYSQDFYVFSTLSGSIAHNVHYNMFFLYRDDGPTTFDWSGSGNPNGEAPREPFHPGTAIAADENLSDHDWQNPVLPAHSQSAGGGRHRETNVLYGDSRVESHRRLEHYVVRGAALYNSY